MVGTVEMKVSELAFILHFDFSYPRSRSSIACIGTTNLIYHHTASRADRLFLIAFEAQ